MYILLELLETALNLKGSSIIENTVSLFILKYTSMAISTYSKIFWFRLSYRSPGTESVLILGTNIFNKENVEVC